MRRTWKGPLLGGPPLHAIILSLVLSREFGWGGGRVPIANGKGVQHFLRCAWSELGKYYNAIMQMGRLPLSQLVHSPVPVVPSPSLKKKKLIDKLGWV